MKFYNRESELQSLENIYELSSKHSQMTVILGRRRIGKSTLVQEFIKQHTKTLYFFVSRKRSYDLLVEFSEIISSAQNHKATYLQWEDFFHDLFLLAQEKHITIIFDEFQNFQHNVPSAFSIIQKYWDSSHRKPNLNLMFIGSTLSMMQHIFENKKEPLFGRATHTIYIKNFSPHVVYTFLKENKKQLSIDDFLDFYTAFGGIPKYYVLLQQKNLYQKNFFTILQTLCFLNDGDFVKEGKDLLIEEFGKEQELYFSLLHAIASSKNTLSEISNFTHIEIKDLPRYIDILENKFLLIEKIIPVFSKKKKITRYRLNDSFLHFWFRYIYKNLSRIESNQTAALLKHFKEDFNILKGLVFEKLIQKILIEENNKGNFFFSFEEVGTFWDRKGNEIDIVAYNKETQELFAGECKLNAKKINTFLIKTLQQKLKAITANTSLKKIHYGLFTAGEIEKKQKLEFEKNGIKIFDGKWLKNKLDI